MSVAKLIRIFLMRVAHDLKKNVRGYKKLMA